MHMNSQVIQAHPNKSGIRIITVYFFLLKHVNMWKN